MMNSADLQPDLAGRSALATLDSAAVDFTEAWLNNRRFSGNTRDAYRRDIHQWLGWCALHELDPLKATFLDVNAWGREMESPTDKRKALAPASIARKMSAASSWYGFIVKLGKLPANPAAIADRPAVDRDFSPTVSFERDDAERMLRVAAKGDPYLGSTAPLLAAWMIQLGTRVSETVNIDLEDISYFEGFWVVQLTLKGGRRQRRALPPPLVVLLEKYRQARAARQGLLPEQLQGALFVDADGNRLNRHDLARFVRRLARAAGIANAERITPHSFRHAWNTMARKAGAGLEARQDAMGHRDPRTTRRYDRTGLSLMNDPSILVAAAMAHAGEELR